MHRSKLAATVALWAFGLSLVACGSAPSYAGDGRSAGGAPGGTTGASGASGSTSGHGGGGAAGAPTEPVPPLVGRWAIFTFEDPVGIELSEEAGVLSGLGCYGGLPTTAFPDLRNYCAPLRGSAEGRHVQFDFRAEGYTYAANVYASADGQRMAGDFHDTGSWHSHAFTWLRVGPEDPWLHQPDEPTAAGAALANRDGKYALQGLVEEDGRPGYVMIYGYFRTIAGSLGAFWETEMTWNEAERTLVAGPVAATDPDLATQLTLHFGAASLLSVDAVFPSGKTATFEAAPFVQR
jgi:hypothetical protein